MGAALALWHIDLNNPRDVNLVDAVAGSILAYEYSQKEIENELNQKGAKFEILDLDELINKTDTKVFFRRCYRMVSRKNGIWTKSIRS